MASQTAPSQALLEEFAGIVGGEHVVSGEAGLSIAPATTEQVAAVVRLANEAGLSVNATGGGTKQTWIDAGRSDGTLRMHRMNAVLEHPWQDMTCVVQAGCRWSAMQEALQQHGQFVALDPLWPECATVGGIVSANDSGALRLRYGSLRDLAIGMTIVLADGTIAKAGGKVVKNVAGYDLVKLMIGSFGTLGVVTEVNFRLHSLPVSTKSFSVASSDAEVLGRLLLQILNSQMCTCAMQICGNEDGFRLDVELASLAEVLGTQVDLLAKAAKASGLAPEECGSAVWRTRPALFERGDGFVVKATMLPKDEATMIARVREMDGASVTQATGVMTAWLPAAAAEQIESLRGELVAAKGSLTVLRQAEGKKIDRWGPLPDSFPLMQRVKQQFDPKRTLNPGRFLGGI